MKTVKEPGSEQDLQLTITSLQARLADLQARLPAHSIPPALIAEMDEIEGLLQAANARLAELRDSQA